MSVPMIDLDRERAELLAMHAAVRRAHYDADPAGVIAHDAQEYITVRNGRIGVRRRDEEMGRFTGYFAGAVYEKWDDVEPPIVTIAADASIAWMIIHVRVRRTQNGHVEDFEYAGIDTYEKRAGRWVKTTETSTFKIHEGG